MGVSLFVCASSTLIGIHRHGSVVRVVLSTPGRAMVVHISYFFFLHSIPKGIDHANQTLPCIAA